MENLKVSKDLQQELIIKLEENDIVFYDDLKLYDVAEIKVEKARDIIRAEILTIYGFKVATIETGGDISISIDDKTGQAREIIIETLY